MELQAMKKIKLLVILAFTLTSVQSLSGEVFSGYIAVSPSKGCLVLWGSRSKDISCAASVDSFSKMGQIKIDFSKLDLKLPPICIVSQSAAFKHSGELLPINPRIATLTTQYLQIVLEGTKSLPQGPVTSLICSLSDEN